MNYGIIIRSEGKKKKKKIMINPPRTRPIAIASEYGYPAFPRVDNKRSGQQKKLVDTNARDNMRARGSLPNAHVKISLSGGRGSNTCDSR